MFRSRRRPGCTRRWPAWTLRSFTWDNVRQLERAAGSCWPGLAPPLPGAGQLAFTGFDMMPRRVLGHHRPVEPGILKAVDTGAEALGLPASGPIREGAVLLYLME